MNRVIPTTRDRDVEFAWEIAKLRIPLTLANNPILQFLNHRAGIVQFPRFQASHWRTSNIADIIHRRLHTRQSDCCHLAENFGQIFNPNPPQLDTLTGSNIGTPIIPIPLNDIAQYAQLVASGNSTRCPQPHHKLPRSHGTKENT